jgi:hypothetical protein
MGFLVGSPVLFADESNNSIEEVHDSEKLDKMLVQYNQEKDKNLESTHPIIDNEQSEVSDAEIEKAAENRVKAGLNSNKLDPKSLKEIKYSEAMKVALGPLQVMSEKQLVTLLSDNTKGTKAEKLISQFPLISLFAVRLIKDKEALPSLVKIIEDEKKLIHFSAAILCSMIFAFILKRFMKKEGRTILKSISLWFLRFLIVSFLRICIVYYFFSMEIGPSLKLARMTFF